MPWVFHKVSCLTWPLLAIVPAISNAQPGKRISFSNDIAPLLTARCMECHGRDPLMANLDLRTREGALKGAKHGPVIVPGNAAESHLYRRLTGQETPPMPLGGRLTDAEIALIKDWIDSGAEWDAGRALAPGAVTGTSTAKKFTDQQRRYWAFQKVVKPAVPLVKDREWGRNPIDALIAAKLDEKKLKPNGHADRVTLIRRATLDLTGLPPTPEDVQGFLSDTSPDAFAKVVDRLLASPQYGERWGRHWLDLARYADTNGFKTDEPRPNIWRYRDYVIRAFNEDKPYDRFIREQIAGDELYPTDLSARIAVGFNRHFTDETNQPVIELRRQETLNDITDTVGAVFMGLTYGCARCHDHKFDPILHKDYYRLQAFFANTRIEDNASLEPAARQRELAEKRAVWEEKTKDIRAAMDKLVAPALAKAFKENFDKFPPEIQDSVNTAPEQRTPIQWQMYYKANTQLDHDPEDAAKRLRGEDKKRWGELAAELARFDGIKPPESPVAQAMIDNGKDAPKTHVLAVGVYDALKEEVQPGFLSILVASDAKITPPEGINSSG